MNEYPKTEKNKIIRGNNRAVYDKEVVFDILDSTFLCHVGIVKNGAPIVIPTSFGREGETLYLHGSTKSQLLNFAEGMQEICITVTLLDGVVLARTMFNTSANYRSVVMFGKASLVEGEEERLRTLKIISDHIIDGRFDEVDLGEEKQIKATQVIKFEIESASAKVRAGGPVGDEHQRHFPVWAGHIPMKTIATKPIPDEHLNPETPVAESAINFHKKYQ